MIIEVPVRSTIYLKCIMHVNGSFCSNLVVFHHVQTSQKTNKVDDPEFITCETIDGLLVGSFKLHEVVVYMKL